MTSTVARPRNETHPTSADSSDRPLAAVPPIRWPSLVAWALLTGLGAATFTWAVVLPAGSAPIDLIFFGQQGSAGALALEDFPDAEIGDHIGHDGQQFYAIARFFPDLDAAAEFVDRPHYRMQRPLFPILTRAMSITGTPDALLRATIVLGVLSLVGGSLATGALAVSLGGKAWHATLFPIVLGPLYAFVLGVADNLATALVVGAVTASLRSRHRLAIALAVLAVLTKEPVWLALVGMGIWRRDRAGFLLTAVPAVVAGLWAVLLRLTVVDESAGIGEVVWPFEGFVDVVRGEAGPNNPRPIWFVLVLLVGLGSVAVCRLRHPLGWPIALQGSMFVMLNAYVVGLGPNATRSVMAMLVLAVVVLVTHGKPTPERPRSPFAANGASALRQRFLTEPDRAGPGPE